MSKTPFAVILFFFTLLFLYTKLAGPIPFSVNSVQTSKSSAFTVSGTGEAAAVPTTAQISLGVTKSAPTVEAAQEQTNAAAKKIIDELKKLGIPDKNIKTTNYSVNPDYDFSAGRQTIRGYTVTQTMDVKIDPIEKAQNAIGAATANGANLVSGVQFVLDETTRENLENEARKQAIEKAKKKAESLAGAAGIRLGKIIDIQESFGGDFPRLDTMSVAKEPAMGGAPELTPGENKVTVTVTLSYETY